MAFVTVGCWNPGCPGAFAVDCRDGNQALCCRACAQAADFVNLGAVRCARCGRWERMSLRLGPPAFARCGGCRAELPADAPVRVFTFDELLQEYGHRGGVNYCGASAFEGLEDEVTVGREALARLAVARGRRAFGLLPPAPKKAMYVRRLDPQPLSNPDVPVQSLQCYHAYCNFALNTGHENAKLFGTLGQYVSDVELVQRLLDTGLTEIWFADPLSKREFELLPTARFAGLFRLA